MSEPVAVIGLGIMGSELAGRLLDAGHRVQGFDIDPARMSSFGDRGGVLCADPVSAVSGCEIAVLSLLTSEISRHVCLGDRGISSAPGRPLLVLDATTGRPSDAVEIARILAAEGIDYADMTVSGNAESARRGDLVAMFGGSDVAFLRARPVIEVLASAGHHVGPVGSGARMKLIVNHVLAVNRAALAEALVVGELSGMDLTATIDVLRDGAAYSRAIDLWGARMVAGDHGHPNARLRQSHKDARLIVEQARAAGASTPCVDAVEQVLADGVSGGLGDHDNSSYVEVLRRRAGVGRVTE